jgi:ankyrin repeat protein
MRIIRLLIILALFLPAMDGLNWGSQPSSAWAQAIIKDELGRIANPEEIFYRRNPPPPGKPPQRIAEVDAYDEWGDTPLMKAVRSRNTTEAVELLNRKANPNLFNAYGRTALEVAAGSNDLDMVRFLLKRGAKANIGFPLTYAKTPEMRALLKQHGANEPPVEGAGAPSRAAILVNTHLDTGVLQKALAEEEKSGKMNPSIPLAVVLKRPAEAIEYLLKEGSDINEVHPNFGTALGRAVHDSRERDFVLLLLESGADANLPGELGSFPLLEAAVAGREDLVALLLAYGAKADIKHSYRGYTALHSAVGKDNPAMVAMLLKAGADINARDRNERTSLHLAVGKDNSVMVAMLLKAGADINARDDDERTPLHLAVGKNNPAMAEMLFKAGADINARDNGGETPLGKARSNPYIMDVLQPPATTIRR